MIGETLGNYRIMQRLSAGGMGEVFVAEHLLIGRKAAIKLLLPDISRKPDLVQRFFNEAKATAAIGHPGIVEIFDFGFHRDDRAYLVMEFLSGEPLQARIKRQRQMPLPEALSLLEHVCSALGAAHRKGIVHRDLKPDNIFLVKDPGVRFGERPKLLDFGIAKLQDSDAGPLKTRTGFVMGTPAYMAPEQCRGAGEVDHRADMYALGCIFFALLCGRPPFVGAGAGEIIGMQQFMEPPRPRQLVPSIDARAEALIMRLLHKDPAGRLQSTDDLSTEISALAASLEMVSSGRASSQGIPIPPAEPPRRPSAPMQPVSAPTPVPAEPPRRPSAPMQPVSAPTPAPGRPATSSPLAGPFAPEPAAPPAMVSAGPPTTLGAVASEQLDASPRNARRVIAMAAGAAVALAAGIVWIVSSSESKPSPVALVSDIDDTGEDTLDGPGGDEAREHGGGDAPVPDEPPVEPLDEPDEPLVEDDSVDMDFSLEDTIAAHPAPTDSAPADPEPAPAQRVRPDRTPSREDTTAVRTPAADEMVTLVIESTPSNAEVRLGSSRSVLGTTPYTHRAPRGSARLTFRVEHAGYQSRRVSMTPTADGTRHVTLERSEVKSGGATKKPRDPKKPPDTKDPFSGAYGR